MPKSLSSISLTAWRQCNRRAASRPALLQTVNTTIGKSALLQQSAQEHYVRAGFLSGHLGSVAEWTAGLTASVCVCTFVLKHHKLDCDASFDSITKATVSTVLSNWSSERRRANQTLANKITSNWTPCKMDFLKRRASAKVTKTDFFIWTYKQTTLHEREVYFIFYRSAYI